MPTHHILDQQQYSLMNKYQQQEVRDWLKEKNLKSADVVTIEYRLIDEDPPQPTTVLWLADGSNEVLRVAPPFLSSMREEPDTHDDSGSTGAEI